MFLARPFAAATTCLLIGGAFFGGGEADMPDGASIFETTGAWEDFATPSRDLRLLIAMDVVRGFPDRVALRPERYAMPKGKSVAEVKAELESVLASELLTRQAATVPNGRSRSKTCSTGRPISRWRTARTTASSLGVGRAGQERGGVDV